MEKKALTSRQSEILESIRAFIVEHGYPPTVRELAGACGLKSPRSASQHLDALEKKGYIRRGRDKSRAIEIVSMRRSRDAEDRLEGDVLDIPLVGTVPAGPPDSAVEDVEAVYRVDAGLFGKGEKFLLRVTGESMVGADIVEGDLLVVERGEAAENGDIVVALIDDEATVKRYAKRRGEILLVPENDRMAPIRLSGEASRVRILGKVVGLLRRLA
jgi:repressor LexA